MLQFFGIDGPLQKGVFPPILHSSDLGWRLFSGLCGDLLCGNETSISEKLNTSTVVHRSIMNWLADERKVHELHHVTPTIKAADISSMWRPLHIPFWQWCSGTVLKDASPSPTQTLWEATILLSSLGPSA